MEKAESDNWKNRIEKEFAEIARERSDAEKFWQKIGDLQINMNSKKETDKQATKKSEGILKRIKEKILPLKKTDGDKMRKRAEIQRERIALERKKEELRIKKEELAKQKSMLKNSD